MSSRRRLNRTQEVTKVGQSGVRRLVIFLDGDALPVERSSIKWF
jgi:hypothetical protein